MKVIITEQQLNESLIPFLMANKSKPPKNDSKSGYQTDIEANKAKYIELLRSTNRNGIENVISFLERSSFFTQWGSNRHHTYKGGLAEHSLGVCERALKRNSKLDRNSVILCTLLHDIGKVYKDGSGYHSQRSIDILNKLGLELTQDEINAILYHTHGKKTKASFNQEDFNKSKKTKLSKAVHTNDVLDAGDVNGLKGKLQGWAMDTFNME